ncbi:MAG: sulfite exporter TauE/SafE family protein [Desulfobacteraceae bacterium]|nr:sulfite exporter TauE/SafE family protein [Desulfobacteraceae bacterium]
MNPAHIAILFGLGIIGGFQNVMAGGGSLLTLPMMIFMLDSMPQYASLPTGRLANGTNRVAILIQNIFAVAGFAKKGHSNIKLSLKLAVFTLPGAILGAHFAGQITNDLFKKILGLIVIAVVVLITQKKRLTKATTAKAHPVMAYLAMFAVGFYGGFIQAGVGFLLIAVLHGLMNLNLIKTNMHKVFIVFLYTIPALLVFVLRGDVIWRMGLVLASGNALGAWLGAHFAVKKGEKLIRIVLLLAMLAMAVKLIFFTKS